MQKENSNPNTHIRNPNPAKSAQHSFSAKNAHASRLNYQAKFIKKSLPLPEMYPSALHSLQLTTDCCLQTPALTEIEALGVFQPNHKQNCERLQTQLAEKTKRFNSAILAFQVALTEMRETVNNEDILTFHRLSKTAMQIEQFLLVLRTTGFHSD